MPMSFMLDFKRDMRMFTHKRAIIFHSQNIHVQGLFQKKKKKGKKKNINPIVPKVVKWLSQKKKIK